MDDNASLEDQPATPDGIPQDLVFARATPMFDAETTPTGLRRAHQVARGAYGYIVVEEGSVNFCFENDEDGATLLEAGDTLVIPPQTPHHVEVSSNTKYWVEFYAAPKNTAPESD